MIAFACHSWSFPDLTLPEAFGLMARLGFRRVDIGSGAALNVARAAADPHGLADELRADLAAFALTVSDLYLMLPRIAAGATPDDAERRARDLDLFRSLLPFAAALGTPGITVSPGLAPADPAELPAAFDRAAAGLRLMLSAAQSAGLPLSIEPHLDSIAPTPTEALRLLAAVPGLKLTLDLAEIACQNLPFDEAAAALPHVRHVHARPAAKGRLQTVLDKNTVPFARWLSALTAAGYSGTVTVELIPPAMARHGAQKLTPLRDAAALRDLLKTERDKP